MQEGNKAGKAQGVEAEKRRAVAITLNVAQIEELTKDEELRKLVIRQMEESEGGLKGNMAIAIGKAMLKQLKLKV